MAAQGDPGCEGPHPQLTVVQPDDGVRQTTGGTHSRQRDRLGAIPGEHRFDRDCHAARTGQSLREQPTLAAAARDLRKPSSALLLRSDHRPATGICHGAAIHLPNLHSWSSLAVARGTPATTHWHRRGAGMGRRGVGDSAGMARCRPGKTGRTTCDGSPWRSLVHGPGIRVRTPLIRQRTPFGHHSLFPSCLDPTHASDGDARRSLAIGVGLGLVARSGCLDTTRPDLGHKRAELSAGSEGDVPELRAGVVCSRLGLDLVQRIDHGIHLHGCCVGVECIVHQPVQPSGVINSWASQGDKATNAGRYQPDPIRVGPNSNFDHANHVANRSQNHCQLELSLEATANQNYPEGKSTVRLQPEESPDGQPEYG